MQPAQEPTRDQLLAMAYADGELNDAGRAEVEQRLKQDSKLGREVADYRALQILGRQLAPPEPMDFEWERLAADPVQRGGVGLGWVALLTGSVGFGSYGVVEVVRSDMPAVPKALVLSFILGFSLLLLFTLRARLRTLPFDPYRSVQR